MSDDGEARGPETKAARTRAQIRASAADLFSRKTYLDTTMDEIAAAAGVSKGGVYYHYRKKSDVLFDIKCQAMEDLWSGLEDALSACPSPRDKLRRLIERQLHYFATHLPQARTLLHDRQGLDADQAAIVGDLEQRYFDFARGLVADAVGSNDPALINPITFNLFALCNWFPDWYRDTGPASAERLARDVATLFLDGLAGFRVPGTP